MTGTNSLPSNVAPLPSLEHYYAAFERLKPRLFRGLLAMLKAHIEAPGQSLTARQLAEAAGYPTSNSANLHYGTLGRLLRKELPYDGPGQQSYSLAYFTKPMNGEWYWTLHPVVVLALQRLGWFATSPSQATSSFPNEIEDVQFAEGSSVQMLINVFERDPRARAACLNHYGTACSACGVKLSEVYGSVAVGFVHIHHLVPLAHNTHEHQVDPIADLRPLCPNCHSIIHLRNPPFTIQEIREMIDKSPARGG